MKRRFSPLRTGDQLLDRVQETIRSALSEVEECPVIGGVYLEEVELANGAETTVPHTLGRIPTGWTVCDSTAAATVYRNSWSTEDIVLTASAATTVKLLVF